MCRQQHFYAYSSCRRVVGTDGQQRESWSFTSGRANTLLGRVIGPIFIALAHMRHERLVLRNKLQNR